MEIVAKEQLEKNNNTHLAGHYLTCQRAKVHNGGGTI